jgi:adenine-specific DNA-methyltransferase
MNSTEIRSILRSPYNRENWKNLYRNIFQNKVTFHEEPYQYQINEDIVESLFQIGYATLDDEYIVALFEINIKGDVNLLSKKIALRKIISKYISDDKFNGVLTIFENGSPDYRFTFASKITKITEEGIEIVETESKRFTYVLGGNEPCLTPTQRFENLFKKNGNINLEDIKDAFSVDKLNKEFFNGYKEHYESLSNFFYSSPLKKKYFKGEDKLVRDFVKKFLGRIVFLYFVQKKGWLGVKKGENWGKGDPLFLSNLFKSYKSKGQFYNQVISKIFFEYLSIDRENDLVTLFDDIEYRIPYLNGGLFEKEDVDHYEINLEDSYLDSLFSFFDRFNFTIYEDDPNEHTVAVDPEMLGHIFENLLEDNKDKGAFYTPKEIVHYMCQESLIEYLTTWFESKGYEVLGNSSFDKSKQPLLFSKNEGRKGQLFFENDSKKIDRFLIENLLKKKLTEEDKNLILLYVSEFHDALDKVKICDPAIGSGAFPMGLLQEIFLSKQTLWFFEHGNMDNFPASKIKSNIIQNSIYGVDIEKGAVDIARLRFWLSLIVDEDEPKSLPNLDYKIVVGNSLLSLFENEIIEIDWNLEFKNVDSVSKIILDQQNKIYQLEHAQHLFFQSFTNKDSLKIQIKRLKIDILKNQLLLTKVSFNNNNPILGGFIPTEKEAEVNTRNRLFIEKIMYLTSRLDEINKNNSNLNLDYFDWRLNFPEVLNSKINANTGFDIVIGNPPYIQLQKDGGYLAKMFEYSNFETYEKTGDIYSLFYEKGIQLLRNDGVLTFITSNKWMRAGYGKSTRKYFCKHDPVKLIDLGGGVFESATVDTNILIIKKKSHIPKTYSIKSLDISKEKKIKSFNDFENRWVYINDISEDSWVISSEIEQQVLLKIDNSGKRLKSLDVQINYGIKTGYNEAFIIDNETRDLLCKKDPKSSDIIKPVLRGKDIKRYVSDWSQTWLITTFPSAKINIDNYPSVKNYLESFGKKIYQTGEKYIDVNGITQNSRKKTGNKWFETQDQISYFKDFEKEKIIYPNMTLYLPFLFDDKKFYTNQKCFIITSKSVNLKFLTGYFNSKISHYWIKKNCPELQGGTRELSKIFFENIPIPNLSDSNTKEIISLVEKIILCKEQKQDSLKYEINIDKILFSYINLNDDEILYLNSQ